MRRTGILNRLRKIKRVYNIPFYVKQGFDKYEKTIKIDMDEEKIKMEDIYNKIDELER